MLRIITLILNAYGGGVIIYASDSLRISRRENLEPIDTECVWTEISDPTCNIFLCRVHRPPNADSSFWEIIRAVH